MYLTTRNLINLYSKEINKLYKYFTKKSNLNSRELLKAEILIDSENLFDKFLWEKRGIECFFEFWWCRVVGGFK